MCSITAGIQEEHFDLHTRKDQHLTPYLRQNVIFYRNVDICMNTREITEASGDGGTKNIQGKC